MTSVVITLVIVLSIRPSAGVGVGDELVGGGVVGSLFEVGGGEFCEGELEDDSEEGEEDDDDDEEEELEDEVVEDDDEVVVEDELEDSEEEELLDDEDELLELRCNEI